MVLTYYHHKALVFSQWKRITASMQAFTCRIRNRHSTRRSRRAIRARTGIVLYRSGIRYHGEPFVVRGSYPLPQIIFQSFVCSTARSEQIGDPRITRNRGTRWVRGLSKCLKRSLKQDSAFIPVGKHAENFRNYRAGQTRDNCRIRTLSIVRHCSVFCNYREFKS